VTEQTDLGVTWLTQEAYDRLKAELDNLTDIVRPEIIKKIEAAREEGDLKENGGYHAAKDEQGKVEARIRQLEDMLRRAEVGETPKDDGIVEPGMKVTYKFVGDPNDTEPSTFLLGNKALDDGTIDVFSPESPLGSAILGAKVGDQVSYTAPTGKELKVEVVAATPYQG
jgi:transcription elongation factor GreA